MNCRFCDTEMEQVDEDEDVVLYECPDCEHQQGARKLDESNRLW